MRILISGGSGLVGSRLKEMAGKQGIDVAILTRDKSRVTKADAIHWDVKKKELNPNDLQGFDAIIHLAGAGIADSRWTESRKKEILNSRVDSAKLLLEALKKLDKRPAHFISSSAIGYYGDSQEIGLTEELPAGHDFLAEVCDTWEKSVQPAKDLGMKLSIVRTGVVLTSKGGALPQLAAPVKFFVGSPLGDGKQWISWIHLDDLCEMYLHLIKNQISGVFNGVAPDPETNKGLVKKVAKQLKKPLFLPAVPSFVLRIVLGEMADVVLKGQHVSSEKIEKTGFRFSYPRAEDALKAIYA